MKINNFILCDDIRTEIGNKKSLMGVYSKEILFSPPREDITSWPKDLILAMMLDFSISGEIKKNAHTFKVTYILNGVEKALGEGKFNIPTKDYTRDDDYQMMIYSKAQYHFEACGELSHCIKIYDSSKKEIAQATPTTNLLLKESVIGS